MAAKVVLAILALLFLALSGATGGVAAPAASGGPAAHFAPNLLPAGNTIGTSVDGAGYAVNTTVDNVTTVSGDWKVPKPVGTCPKKYEYVFAGVGLDGWASHVSGWAGTLTECVGGLAYYGAIYTFYPNEYVDTLHVHPGDHMRAIVQHVHGTGLTQVNDRLIDLTTGFGFYHTAYLYGVKAKSATWTVEAAVNSTNGHLTPLLDFGKVTFTNCTARIGGHTHPVGGYSWVGIAMYNIAHSNLKALPGVLSSSGKLFTVAWKSAGP